MTHVGDNYQYLQTNANTKALVQIKPYIDEVTNYANQRKFKNMNVIYFVVTFMVCKWKKKKKFSIQFKRIIIKDI